MRIIDTTTVAELEIRLVTLGVHSLSFNRSSFGGSRSVCVHAGFSTPGGAPAFSFEHGATLTDALEKTVSAIEAQTGKALSDG